MTEGRIDIDVNALGPREVPNPAQSWETAQRCIRNACPAGKHDWIDLTGVQAYWRECRVCGITDVTAQALGQDVETPNDYRE